MADWIEVNPAEFEISETDDSVEGVQITIGMHPDDLPDGVRKFVDGGTLTIEFRYFEERLSEPTQIELFDDHTRFVIGRNSGRIHQICVDVDALGAGAVAVEVQVATEVEKAMRDLIRKHKSHTRRMKNHVAAGKVLRGKQEELLVGAH